MNEKLRDILSELYNYHAFGDEAEAVEVAEAELHSLVSKTVSQPLHEAARAHDVSSLLADYPELEGGYSDGMSTGLCWALSKVDRLFGEE